MKRVDVKELHYITHIDNLRLILQYGILCHHKAKKVLRQSIADPEIQKRREKVVELLKEVSFADKISTNPKLFFQEV